jgi:hypothetical protein
MPPTVFIVAEGVVWNREQRLAASCLGVADLTLSVAVLHLTEAEAKGIVVLLFPGKKC